MTPCVSCRSEAFFGLSRAVRNRHFTGISGSRLLSRSQQISRLGYSEDIRQFSPSVEIRGPPVERQPILGALCPPRKGSFARDRICVFQPRHTPGVWFAMVLIAGEVHGEGGV